MGSETKRASKISHALAVIAEHPDWSNKKIAETVGCNPAYLSQSKKFKAARNAVKGVGQESLRKGKRLSGRDMDV